MEEEFLQQIQQLQIQIDTLNKELVDIKKRLSEHQHSGFDGSSKILESSVVVKNGKAIGSGCTELVGYQSIPLGLNTPVYTSYLLTGPEGPDVAESLNTSTKDCEIVTQYINGATTFIFPLQDAVGVDCSTKNIYVSQGQTIFSDSSLDLGEDNSKIGYYLFLRRYPINPDDTTDFAYPIASNTKNSVTLQTPITFSGKIQAYAISAYPILGSSLGQFKKIYTLDGVRFGPGQSGNGQNGLLFMDTDGSLKYKKPDNTTVSLGGYSYTTYALTFSGSTTTASVTVPSGAKITGYWVPQNGWLGTPANSWVQLYISGTTLYGVLSTAPGTNNYITIYVGILY
jgi:hypothetical protein